MWNNIKEKSKLTFNKLNIVSRYSTFIDNFILIISLWLSIVIIVYYNDYLPNFNWPIYIDKLLLFIGIYFLIYLTLKLLRFFIFWGVICAMIYFLSLAIIDVYEDYRDPRYTKHEETIKIDSGIVGKFIDKYFKFPSEINSLNKNYLIIKNKLDSVNNKLDSLNKANIKVDSLKKVK